MDAPVVDGADAASHASQDGKKRKREDAPRSATQHEAQRLIERKRQLETCFFGRPPQDDLTAHIADFLLRYCSIEGVEIEGKLGCFVQDGQRIAFPVSTECVLNWDLLDGDGVTFSSDTTMDIFKRFNERLNAITNDVSGIMPGAVTYSHRKLEDVFYTDGTRVTTDQETKEVVSCIKKERVADINIFSPKSPLDIRISARSETVVPHPRPDVPKRGESRVKDRVSYMHGCFSYDLTRVFNKVDGGEKISWEMEIEVRGEALRSLSVSRNPVEEARDLAIRLLNNLRAFARY